MYHLIVFLLTFISYLTLSDIPSYLRTTLIAISFVSIALFFKEKYGEERKKVIEIAKISETKKKEELEYFDGTYYDSLLGYVPYLKDYYLVSFETENGLIEGFCNKEEVLNKIKNYKGKVRVYYYERFIIEIEIIKSI